MKAQAIVVNQPLKGGSEGEGRAVGIGEWTEGVDGLLECAISADNLDFEDRLTSPR